MLTELLVHVAECLGGGQADQQVGALLPPGQHTHPPAPNIIQAINVHAENVKNKTNIKKIIKRPGIRSMYLLRI